MSFSGQFSASAPKIPPPLMMAVPATNDDFAAVDETPLHDEAEKILIEAETKEVDLAPKLQKQASLERIHQRRPTEMVLQLRLDEVQQAVEKRHAEIDRFLQSLHPFLTSAENSPKLLVRLIQRDRRACFRFLKARAFNNDKAVQMFKEAVKYRDDQKLDEILTTPLPYAPRLQALSRHSYHGTTRNGDILYIESIGDLDVESLESSATVEERLRYHYYHMEYFFQVLLPLSTRLSGRPQDKLFSIVNMKGFRRGLITKSQYHFVSSVMKINSLIYPENLRGCWVVNAPTVFWIAWSMVKGFLDSETKNKIHIFTDCPTEKLLEMIDADQLPKTFGGKCECGVKYKKEKEKESANGESKSPSSPSPPTPPTSDSFNGCLVDHPHMRQFLNITTQKAKVDSLLNQLNPPTSPSSPRNANKPLP